MNRAMYSGVSGMRAHQTKMDVIGNNIANVNTYGFKSSRTTFRDVYYQTVKSSAAATTSSGGVNPSGIGYGTQVGSVDLLMSQSSFTMTDNAMDLAVDGEGFFQVQDANGNRFFTRAGQMNFDSAGNLVDSQGNFVLGVSGNPIGKAPGSDLIQLQIPAVNPTPSAAEATINGVKFNIKATNATADGNVSFQFVTSGTLTDGEKAVAEVGTSGIVITLNENETFATMAELNSVVNAAIEKYSQANTGASHPAGNFMMTMTPADAWPAGGLTGAQICSTDYTVQDGTISNWPNVLTGLGISLTGETGTGFSASGALTAFSMEKLGDGNLNLSLEVGGVTYTGVIDPTRTSAGSVKLTNGSGEDYIVINRPSYTDLEPTVATGSDATANRWDLSDKLSAAEIAKSIATPSKANNNLGLSSKKIILSGGTEGGPQGIEDLTGISIGADGVITAQHGILGDITVGRIDLATFANPQGLVQSGGTYFTTSSNSGTMNYCQPGLSGAGQLVAGSLELSNVDLSREFSDMITTQRGYQASSRLITVSDDMLEELVNLKR
ncbi:MAG: flagellar hook-basal body complex protein [Oscillospiraceae bacterium]|nr:flagellar hook-basal body complex protein [Oscillospiraceae bacterium]